MCVDFPVLLTLQHFVINFIITITMIMAIMIIISSSISNSNWTEWSTIQGVIKQVIQNRTSAKREAHLKLRARLLPLYYRLRNFSNAIG